MEQELQYEVAEEGKQIKIDPRVFINAFPKSGTHLAEQYVQKIVFPMNVADKSGNLKPWAGSFVDHSWTTHWAPEQVIFRRLGYIIDGTYAKGHMGYRDTIERFLWGNRIATLFVYRDLRDVAVSLTHHILNGQTHSHPEWYQAMGFEGALIATIVGLGPYAGVIERWNEYAQWLSVDWVLPLRFEDLAGDDREGVAAKIVEYALKFAARGRGYGIEIDPDHLSDVAAKMAENTHRTDRSPTFRKGESGGWRDEFTPAAVELFKMEDEKWAKEFGLEEESWLVALGYEDNTDWSLE